VFDHLEKHDRRKLPNAPIKGAVRSEPLRSEAAARRCVRFDTRDRASRQRLPHRRSDVPETSSHIKYTGRRQNETLRLPIPNQS
jgi:hypothetical protein